MFKGITHFIFIIIFILILFAILGYIIMWLWNDYLVPISPQSINPITWEQAIGLKILIGLLTYGETAINKDKK